MSAHCCWCRLVHFHAVLVDVVGELTCSGGGQVGGGERALLQQKKTLLLQMKRETSSDKSQLCFVVLRYLARTLFNVRLSAAQPVEAEYISTLAPRRSAGPLYACNNWTSRNELLVLEVATAASVEPLERTRSRGQFLSTVRLLAARQKDSAVEKSNQLLPFPAATTTARSDVRSFSPSLNPVIGCAS